MANVVDPNSWRMAQTPDSHLSKFARENKAIHAGETGYPAVALLATALERTFSASGDRVIWRLQGASSDQHLRIDAGHGRHRVTAQKEASSGGDGLGMPWHVLVQTAQEVANENGSPELRAELENDVRLLLIVCGDSERSALSAAERELAERVAARLRLPYFEPRAPENEDELANLLAEVKRSGNSSVLYFNTGFAVSSPHFLPSQRATRALVDRQRSYRDITVESLESLQAADASIVLLSTESEQVPVTVLLQQCTSLAAAGRRPFLLMSLDEALDNLTAIRRGIASDRTPLNIIVEGHSERGVLAHSSQLACLRDLSSVNLLSPKDGNELSQMLAWSAIQVAPVILWLADSRLPVVEWPHGEHISTGRAERLGAGADVALVAWGTTNAAAAIAAESLAQLNIRATVINARFAQPLDIDCLVAVCAETAYTVILDDSPSGGFSAWVCEQLVRRGLGPNMTIVSPDSAPAVDQLEMVHSLASVVVQRCRWLAEQFSGDSVGRATTISPVKAVSARPISIVPNVPRLDVSRKATIQAEILATPLSVDAQRWVALYEEVGARDVYLWQWCAHGVELTTIPSVSQALRAHVRDTKVLSIILCVLLDDVADEHGDGDFLDALLELSSFERSNEIQLAGSQARHAEITRSLWSEYWTRVASYPRYGEFGAVLKYDLQQFQNTMRYSSLINGRPYLLNLAEHELYTSHNMMIVSFSTLDLMCSPDFPLGEVGALREMAWHAQCMGRYGNLLSTWRRELANGDFTSGVFAHAIATGHLTYETLARQDVTSIEKMVGTHGHEDFFYERWLEHRKRCHACAGRVTSLDLSAVLNGHDQFFAMHLGSEGLI